jgi:hypothetical protein
VLLELIEDPLCELELLSDIEPDWAMPAIGNSATTAPNARLAKTLLFFMIDLLYLTNNSTGRLAQSMKARRVRRMIP